MTLFDLLFVVLLLVALGTLIAALVAAVGGRSGTAWRRLRALALAALGYMAIVAITSLVVPRAVVRLGEEQCSDDWCVAVTGARPTSDTTVAVTFVLTSRAQRVTQRERYVVAYLRDAAGHRYDADPAVGQLPFDVALDPGESVRTERVFRVSGGARNLGVIVTREGDVPFPRCCIIGTGILHKDAIVPLP